MARFAWSTTVWHPLLLAGTLLAVCPERAAAQAPAVRTVIGINWSTEDFPSSPVSNAAIREVFSSRPDLAIEYFAEYLESDLFPVDVASEALRDYIARKFAGRRIDVVLANTDPAVQFAVQYRPQLFPDAPIVFAGTRLPDSGPSHEPPGITGVLSGTGYRESLAQALSLHPGTRRVLVVAQGPQGDTAFAELVRGELTPLADRVMLDFVRTESLAGLLAIVKAAPPDSLVYYLTFWDEAPANRLLPTQILALVADAAPVPVYGVHEVQLGTGIVGGVVRGTRDGGARMAGLVLRILDGARAQDLPLEQATLVPMFDWRQLRRWNIASSQLPAGADIRFREPTVWELYRGYLLAIAAVVGVQSVLIAALVVQQRRRRHAERIASTTASALNTSYQEIRRLAHDLIAAQENERTRLARELHDDVGQRVASLLMGLSSVSRTLDGRDREAREHIEQIQEQLFDLSDGLRQLSHEWHPGTLEHIGLVAAIEARAGELRSEAGVDIRFEVAEAWRPTPPNVTICLYRIAQESLRNIAKHARARTVSIRLDRQPGAVTMRIADDGAGFETNGRPSGLGLASMRERARMLGGGFELRSAPNAGTVMEITLPVEEMVPLADSIATA